jgi:serine/threonine protein kinase
VKGCPEPELLERLVNGDVSAAGEDALASHVEACAACQAVLDELTRPSIVPPRGAWTVPRAAAPVPHDSGDDLPEVLGYDIRDRLGLGGMGAVFRAREAKLGRYVAIKVLLRRHRGRPDLERRFEEEARLTSRLRHPGIPPVHDVGTLPDGRPFFAMKLVKGQALDDLLKERPDARHDLPRFLAYFQQVCQTMAYAHGKGVIHRDLKPGNVMAGNFGEVHVMDWGLARVLSCRAPDPADVAAVAAGAKPAEWLPAGSTVDQCGGKNPLGTPQYMPPEQARGGSSHADERADVFGLGAILCEILTGRPPFVGDHELEVVQKAAAEELADAFSCLDGCGADTELIALCKACLAPRAVDRPCDGRAVAERVAAYTDLIAPPRLVSLPGPTPTSRSALRYTPSALNRGSLPPCKG